MVEVPKLFLCLILLMTYNVSLFDSSRLTQEVTHGVHVSNSDGEADSVNSHQKHARKCDNGEQQGIDEIDDLTPKRDQQSVDDNQIFQKDDHNFIWKTKRPSLYSRQNYFDNSDPNHRIEKEVRAKRSLLSSQEKGKSSFTCNLFKDPTQLECDGMNNPNVQLSDVLNTLQEKEHDSLWSINLTNFNFGTIHNGSFKGFVYMTSIILLESNVTIIEQNAFHGLDNLRILYLEDTGHHKTGLTYLSKDMLLHCSKLQQIQLGKVQSMDDDTFDAVPILSEVYVKDTNTLLDHYHIFGKINKLEILSANGLGLTEFPVKQPFKTQQKLQLDFKNNKITNITKSSMSQFESVASLLIDLENNDVKKIEPNFLQDIDIFILLLRFRKNRNLGNDNFAILLESLKHKTIYGLDVTACGISLGKFDASILSPLHWSDLGVLQIQDNVLGAIESDAFDSVKHSLEILEISNFMKIAPGAMRSFPKLKNIIIQNTIALEKTGKYYGTIDLNENEALFYMFISNIDSSRISIKFDKLNLSFFAFYNMEKSFHSYFDQVKSALKNIYEHYPEQGSFVILMGNLLFLYSDEELCSMFSHIQVNQLNLRNNYFPRLPTRMFYNSNITGLDLSRNKINYIQKGLFDNIRRLRSINLSQNVIQHIDGNAFLHVTTSFYYYNHLFENQIMLENNLFVCDCNNEPLRDWILQNEKKFIITYDKNCMSPDSRIHEEFLKVRIPWMECNTELFTKISVISGSSLVVIIITIASLLKYFWKDIKYRQMVRRARKHDGFDPLVDNPEEEIYDAFVSYHPEKRIWLTDVMTQELKDGEVEFTLMYDVNILPTGGESYFGGIFRHMDRSRHVIFLVTRGWMKEGMNEFEMEAAVDMLKQTKRHTLIVIMMENIPKKEMSETLQLMVRNNVCLKWSENEREQRKFWRDLKLELGKKKYN